MGWMTSDTLPFLEFGCWWIEDFWQFLGQDLVTEAIDASEAKEGTIEPLNRKSGSRIVKVGSWIVQEAI